MNILTQLFEITLLKRRPQDLDYDQGAAVYYLLLAIGLQYLLTALSGQYSQPLLFSAVQYLCQAAVLYAFLSLANKQVRYIQSATALFGVTAILSLAMLITLMLPALGILSLFIMVWSFLITVLIIRDAFDTNVLAAIFITIASTVVSVLISITLLPEFKAELFEVLQAAKNATA